MSGHNKWSTIKHRKGAQDAKRGKIFSKIIKEITIAARDGGGDVKDNARLRRVVIDARAANMANETLERAIKKGTGELEGVQYEELLYEGVGPAGTLFMLPTVTDNRNRTAAEFRKIFDKHNGELGVSGAAAWAFEEKGVIRLAADAATEKQLFETAVGAGAEDLENIEDEWVITTPREELDTVRTAIEEAGIAIAASKLEQIPNVVKEVDGRDAEVLMNLVDTLEDHDDIQNVFADFELSAEALAKLAED